jgi:hypothetical protein
MRLRETAENRQATLARARRVLEERQVVRDSLDRVLRAIIDLGPRLVDGNSQTDAQTSLASLVSLAAGRHGLKTIRLDPVPGSQTSDTVGVFVRVRLHGEFEGDALGLSRLLRAIETSRALLTVNTMAIGAANPGARSDRPEQLSLELNVSGYYLPRGSK